MDVKINPVSGLQGTIEPPGDKSISHRALLLGSLAQGRSSITNFLNAQDCLSTLHCLEMLGVEIDQKTPSELEIQGVGFFGFQEPAGILNAGNSGTTLRMLPGILAGQHFFSVLTGDDSLRQRPMQRITKPLSKMGARIWGRQEANLAPIAIKGTSLKAISYTTPVPSAQVKTALLLAGLLASGTSTIKEKFRSRDHSERMLRFLGAEIEATGTENCISGEAKLHGSKISIPGDISSAAFFIIAGLILHPSEILIKNVGLNPTRTGMLRVLETMGANIHQQNADEVSAEPRADVLIKSSNLKSFEISEEAIPSVIDELPILAVAATQSQGTSTVSGAQELRVKESDRIASICSQLKKMGADIEERKDGFIIKGPTKLKGMTVDSLGDHRLAMALAIAGLVADGTTTIKNAQSINISFPGFFETLQEVAG